MTRRAPNLDWSFRAITVASALAVGLGVAYSRTAAGLLVLCVAVVAFLSGAVLASRSPGRPFRARERGARERDVVASALFACLVAGVSLTTWNAIRAGPTMSAGDVLLALAAVGLTVRWLRGGHLQGSAPAWLPIAGGTLLAAGLLAMYRTGIGGNLAPTLQFAGALVLMPLLVLHLTDTPRRVVLLIESWLLFVVVSSAVGIADLLLHLNIDTRLTGEQFVSVTERAPGLTVHPNALGLVAAMALPVASVRAARGAFGHAFAFSPLHAVYTVVLLGGVLISGSRAALVGATVGLLITPLLQARGSRSPVTLALIVLMLGGVAWVISNPSVAAQSGVVAGERLTGAPSQTAASDQARREITSSSIEETLANPVVGQGFATVRRAHNIYLQLLEAGGILALAGFSLFAGGSLLAARRLLGERSSSSADSGLPVALAASLLVWLTAGLFQNALYDRYLYIPVAILLAMRAIHVRELPTGRDARTVKDVAPAR